jgi:hypothetical protein
VGKKLVPHALQKPFKRFTIIIYYILLKNKNSTNIKYYFKKYQKHRILKLIFTFSSPLF